MAETREDGKWHIKGYDPLKEGAAAFYPIPGEWGSREVAERAAAERLEELRRKRSSQGSSGSQHWVFIVRPDGTTYRYFGERSSK